MQVSDDNQDCGHRWPSCCGRSSPKRSGSRRSRRRARSADRRSRAHRPRPEQPRPRPDPDPLPAARLRRPGRDRRGRPCELVVVVDPAAPMPTSNGVRRLEPTSRRRRARQTTDRAASPPRRSVPLEPTTPAQPAVHVRDLRQGRVEPVRPRRRAPRRRDAGPLLQPAVHLRLGGPRQDPPAPRHRPLRPPQLPAPRRALRVAPRRS